MEEDDKYKQSGKHELKCNQCDKTNKDKLGEISREVERNIPISNTNNKDNSEYSKYGNSMSIEELKTLPAF
jgi:hypothetical protein